MSCATRMTELTRALARRREVFEHLRATLPLEDPRVQLALQQVTDAVDALLACDCSE